jgi:hypothetical protein
VNERQINEWLDSPVTERFFKRVADRADTLENAAYLTMDPTETFRIGWELAGGIAELRALEEEVNIILGDDDE